MARVKVEDLLPGTFVDLEGDPYADPDKDNPVFPYELERVHEVSLETPECVLVYFDFDAVGFPLGHELTTVYHKDLPA